MNVEGWKLDFVAPAGTRFLKKFIWISPIGRRDIWWCHDLRRWINDDERRELKLSCSSTAPCRTFKAFKRHLRKHGHILTGREIVLVNRYRDNDVIANPITRVWVS